MSFYYSLFLPCLFLASSPLLGLQIELKKIDVVFVAHRLLNAVSSEELNRKLHLLCLCNDTGDAYSDKGDHKLAAANAQRPRLTRTGISEFACSQISECV